MIFQMSDKQNLNHIIARSSEQRNRIISYIIKQYIVFLGKFVYIWKYISPNKGLLYLRIVTALNLEKNVCLNQQTIFNPIS